MNRVILAPWGLFAVLLVTGSAQQAPASGTTLTLLALNQPPCATPSKESVITAKLAYALAAQEQAEEGFEVTIKFQTTNPKMTFSSGRLGRVKISARRDTLTLSYPMAAIWNNPQLKRPLTCYFYLHRNLGNGRSTVIAKTPPVQFSECQ